MKSLSCISLMVLALMLIPTSDASAVTIVTHFIGGTPPPNAAGAGNLVDIFNAAAHRWEAEYGDDFTLTLYYGWGPEVSAAAHSLVEQGGIPNRETIGTIIFNNTGTILFFQDPTPDLDDEYRRRTEEYQDLGGGFVNVARIYSNPTGDAVGRCDLLSVAMHEIGHALGLSGTNASFLADTQSRTLNLTGGLPFAGSSIPLAANGSGAIPHLDPAQLIYGSLMAGVNSDERRLPSALDILTDAEISGFRLVNLGQVPAVPAITSSTSGESRPVPGSASQGHRGN